MQIKNKLFDQCVSRYNRDAESKGGKIYTMKTIFPFFILALALVSCNNRDELADAYGNFEADDVIVAAEVAGKVLAFNLQEGTLVDNTTSLGVIDTTATVLQICQLEAQIASVNSKIANVKAQIDLQKQQKKNLQVNANRVNKLLESGAATQQQKDDLDGQLLVVEKQIDATETQIISIRKDVAVLNAQKQLLYEQLSHCSITCPVNGTVLEKYVNMGEVVSQGKPLFKVADLSSLTLRCYISGDKLSSIKLGQTVDVYIDTENGKMDKLSGTVAWISDEAEFTPKIIQTKEERVKLMYAVKVTVKNDGRLKIGMPGEIRM